MTRFLLGVLGALTVVLTACGGAARPIFEPSTSSSIATSSSSVATSTATSPTTTAAPTSTMPPPTTVAPSWLPASSCRLSEGANLGNIGLGFPRNPDRLPSIGTVRGIVLFADFEDAPASRTTDEVLSIVSPLTEDFFAAVSYGRLDLMLIPHHEWLRLGEPSSVYGDAITEFGPHRDHVQEAMSLADDDVDFTGFDLVVVLNTPNAEAITFGPTYTGFRGGGEVEADGHTILNGVTSGVDILHWGGLWLPHEMGHTLGLVDLYSYEGLTGFTGEFGLMNDIAAQAPELLAYERWLLGWLDDDQILCVGGATTALLEPIERPGGLKALSVPVGDSRAVMVESRRAIGFDQGLARPGAVVYVVDTAVESGFGPIEVVNFESALRAGDSVSVDGVTITVLEADDEGDLVAVEVSR